MAADCAAANRLPAATFPIQAWIAAAIEADIGDTKVWRERALVQQDGPVVQRITITCDRANSREADELQHWDGQERCQDNTHSNGCTNEGEKDRAWMETPFSD